MTKAELLYAKLANAIEAAPEIPPCQTTDPEIWFLEREQVTDGYKTAIKFCATCPVKKQCADYAIEAEEVYGVWGGLTPMQRRKMRVALKRTRERLTSRQG